MNKKWRDVLITAFVLALPGGAIILATTYLVRKLREKKPGNISDVYLSCARCEEIIMARGGMAMFNHFVDDHHLSQDDARVTLDHICKVLHT